eukprot:gene1748-1948_t
MSLKSRSAARNGDCPSTAVQMCTNFKKFVAKCKKAGMSMKSASGIEYFQEEHGYGAWFNQLFQLKACKKEQQINELIDMVKDMASKNLMAEFLEFARQEASKEREYELRHVKLLTNATQPQPQPPRQPQPSIATSTIK